MTYATGFFLVFTGMLIGYCLWYRERGQDDARKSSLTRENEELRATINLAQNSHDKLSDRFTRQKGQLNVLQQLYDDWSSSREQSERDRSQLKIEVADKTQHYQRALAELQVEKQKRIELEDEAHHLTQQQTQNLDEMENDWRERQSKTESSLAKRQAELKRTREEIDQLAGQLHSTEAQLAESEAEWLAGKPIEKNHERLEQSRVECASALSAQKVAEQSLETLQESYEELHLEKDELSSQLGNLTSLQAQNSSFQQSMTNSEDQLEKVGLQRDEAFEAEKSSLAQVLGLQKRLENQEASIQGLRKKRDDALENVKLEVQRRSEIEQSHEQKVSSLESRLKEQSAEFQRQSGERAARLEMDHSEFKNRISMQSDMTAPIKGNQEELAGALDAAKQELNRSKTQARELTAKVEELKTTCLRISELEKLVQRRDLEDAKLVDELSALREKHAESHHEQQELQVEFDRVCEERQDRESEYATIEQQMDVLRTKLKASEETIRTLRRERAAVLARLADLRTIAEPDNTVISFTEAMLQRQREAASYDAEYRGHTSLHAVRGLVYTEPPETQDDLKQISGIAEILEARLNDCGIYTFKQIMDWETEAIEEFSRLLAFKDRIQRDDWIGQAQYFYNQKRNRNPTSRSAA